MLVKVLDVLPLLLELFFDSQKPGKSQFCFITLSCSVRVMRDVKNPAGDGGSPLLSLLFLADVELLGSSLSLGECVAINPLVSHPFDISN